MKAIKYLTLALLALPLTGLAQTYTLSLVAEPSRGGSVSGSGTYEAGTTRTISASTSTSFTFEGWYDEDGNLMSTAPSASYTMPEHDVTLTARFSYNPALPDEPQTPATPAPKYKLTLLVNPPNAGSISNSLSNLSAEEGASVTPNVSVASNWKFREWRDDEGTVVSREKSFSYTMPGHPMTLTAFMDYDPSVADDPGSLNSWDPFTGELIILKVDGASLQNTCNTLIATSERPLVKKLVVADPDFNSTGSNISYIRSYLTGVEVVDLSKSGYVAYSSSELSIPTMKKVILPAGTKSFGSSTFSTSGNAALEEIWIYATTPPTSGASTLRYVPATCVIYVPNERVEAYEAADYWKDHEIRPMISEDNAVGPDDAEWNDLTRLHKIPFTYTYTGGQGGSIEYMVEEDGTWHTLRRGLAPGETVEGYALVTFVKTRSLHTVDYRIVDGGNVTPLADKRAAFVDLGFKSITVAGPNYYNYGEALEPELSVADVETRQYAVLLNNNVRVGRATVRIAGQYPYTIGYRSTTFDVLPLPLPGSVEFVDPNVSLAYCGDYIRPEWRFTDPRNAALVNNTDYTYTWSNSYYVGTANLTITGKGQFTGTISYDYDIVKGPPLPAAYKMYVSYPDEEILYDGKAHGISAGYYSTSYGGKYIFEYYDHETGVKLDSAPIEPGEYEGWIGFEEGPNTLAAAPECRVVYTIFRMDDSEWEAIQALSADLATHGYTTGWSFSNKLNALRFSGIKLQKGLLTEINMPDKNMTGIFPESIYAFGSLKRIDLSGNRLNGTFDGSNSPMPGVEYVDLTGNLFAGDLSEMAAAFPDVQTLKVSGNRLSSVSTPLPSTITCLETGGQNTSITTNLDFTAPNTASIIDAVPTIALYDHATRSYLTDIDMWLTTSAYKDIAQLASSSWAVKLTSSNVEKVSDNVEFTGDNGSTIHVLTADNTGFDAVFTFLPGDTDFDRAVTVLDLQGVINCIFDDVDTTSPFNRTAADTKADGSINVFDVATIVNTIVNTPLSASAIKRARANDGTALAYCSDGALMLSSSEPVSAFDVVLTAPALPKRIAELDAAGFNYTVSGGRLVAYSLTGATLPAGTTRIATIEGDTSVAYAMLANKQAKAITAGAGVQTGIEALTADSNEGEWYNLQGISIDRPTAPGIYIHNNMKITIR